MFPATCLYPTELVIGCDGRVPTCVSHTLLSFTVSLASSARLFSAAQVSRHPEISWRGSPERRAREWLQTQGDIFERLPRTGPHVYRLTRKAMQEYGVTHKRISGQSQRVEHWLGIGDIWLSLTFAGGRPEEWRTEPDGQFDVAFTWEGRKYLLEYQRTPITERQWRRKWEARKTWYKLQNFRVGEQPHVVLIADTGQQEETMCVPRGTVVCRKIEELPRKLRRP